MTSVASSPELVPVKDRNVNTIITLFTERVAPVNENIEFRLREYSKRMQEANPDSWFEWMHRGIMTVATKTRVEQRTIAYLLGIYKAWLTYGMGNCRMSEVSKIKDKISKGSNVIFSEQGIAMLEALVSKYGPLEVYDTYVSLENLEPDPSVAIVKTLGEELAKKRAKGK